MGKSIYLVNPASDAPVYFGTEVLGSLGIPRSALIADLATTTVAALIPREFDVEICDEHIAPADLDRSPDFVGLTGKSNQVGRMIELAQAFRKRGRTVIIGGPYASLDPDAVRPYCDILVRGEMEEIAAELFSDLAAGRWREEYVGTKPDLSASPIPRWEIYPNDRALMGCVQTSRGCPFDCEYCDVIQYVGRKQRHKSVDQVLQELDLLYGLGYRKVFLADDNFAVYRRRSRELLTALREWNRRRTNGMVSFSTQLSIDLAKEDDILRLCYEAGLTEVFIGIETPNVESLKETRKRQNVGLDLVERIQRFLDHGIHVIGGMMVGFDSDKADIFEIQYNFAMSTPVPMFTLGALTAPKTTPLYERLKQSGRLLEDGDYHCDATPWSTNVIPKQMSRDEFFSGMRWLANSLYHPDAFGERLRAFIENVREPETEAGLRATPPRASRRIDLQSMKVIQSLAKLGPGENRLLSEAIAASGNKSVASRHVTASLFRYAQIRYLYEHGRFWDPHLADTLLNA